MMQPIFFVTGPPGAGKSTLCSELLSRFELGLHIPVDDMRQWVVSGLHDSVEWTDETERQFQISEAATCDVAKRYQAAGFAVAVDHCRNIPRLNKLIEQELEHIKVVKVAVLPGLETNLDRNRLRTNKTFDPVVLEPIITEVSHSMREHDKEGWIVLDSSVQSPQELATELLQRCGLEAHL